MDLCINERPIAIVAGDFNRDGNTDLAVLMEDTGEIWIYTGNGNGTFQHTFSIPVGEEATGLTVVPGNGPGCSICWWATASATCLILVGKRRRNLSDPGEPGFALRRARFAGPGQAGVLVGDQQNDRVTVQAPSATATSTRRWRRWAAPHPRPQQLAPGDVQWAFLDKGSAFPDAIVVGTGSNSVEVYRTISITNGVPTFAPSPETYFVGTAPASVTVADINGDGIPDMLVADQGSNDVSVIFGSYNAERRLGGHRRAAAEVRRRRTDRGDRRRSDRRTPSPISRSSTAAAAP